MLLCTPLYTCRRWIDNNWYLDITLELTTGYIWEIWHWRYDTPGQKSPKPSQDPGWTSQRRRKEIWQEAQDISPGTKTAKSKDVSKLLKLFETSCVLCIVFHPKMAEYWTCVFAVVGESLVFTKLFLAVGPDVTQFLHWSIMNHHEPSQLNVFLIWPSKYGDQSTKIWV